MDSTDEDGGLMNEQLLVLSGEGGVLSYGMCKRCRGAQLVEMCL